MGLFDSLEGRVYCAIKRDPKGKHIMGDGRNVTHYSVAWINKPSTRDQQDVILAVGLTRGNEVYESTHMAPYAVEVIKGKTETTIIVYSTFSDKNAP